MAAGYCSGRIIFAFEANLLPLLIPSESTEMRTRSQTFHGHEQLTVAFHLRFLMFDNHSSATFTISTQKAHTNSQSPTDFINNLGYYEFSKILSRLWLFSSCLSRFLKKKSKKLETAKPTQKMRGMQECIATAFSSVSLLFQMHVNKHLQITGIEFYNFYFVPTSTHYF